MPFAATTSSGRGNLAAKIAAAGGRAGAGFAYGPVMPDRRRRPRRLHRRPRGRPAGRRAGDRAVRPDRTAQRHRLPGTTVVPHRGAARDRRLRRDAAVSAPTGRPGCCWRCGTRSRSCASRSSATATHDGSGTSEAQAHRQLRRAGGADPAASARRSGAAGGVGLERRPAHARRRCSPSVGPEAARRRPSAALGGRAGRLRVRLRGPAPAAGRIRSSSELFLRALRRGGARRAGAAAALPSPPRPPSRPRSPASWPLARTLDAGRAARLAGRRRRPDALAPLLVAELESGAGRGDRPRRRRARWRACSGRARSCSARARAALSAPRLPACQPCSGGSLGAATGLARGRSGRSPGAAARRRDLPDHCSNGWPDAAAGFALCTTLHRRESPGALTDRRRSDAARGESPGAVDRPRLCTTVLQLGRRRCQARL